MDLYTESKEAATMELPTVRRSQTHPREPRSVSQQPFAGRIGGNQLFALSPSDPNYDKVTATVPDAARTASWKELLDLRGFRDLPLWKNAVIEGIGLMLQVFISGLISAGVVPTVNATSVGPIFPVTMASVTQFIMITLFIFGAGPITGAHFNPLITISTFLTKLTSLPRAVLYVVFQCIGAVVGAFILRAALGATPQDLAVTPGCYIDPTLVTPGEAFALETMGSLFLIFLAFGLGLDPRNAGAFGPSLGPFLIGLASALTLFAGGIARKGYLGISNNPARCLGLMAAADRFTYHYIHWFGDIAAAVINAIMYYAIPPYEK